MPSPTQTQKQIAEKAAADRAAADEAAAAAARLRRQAEDEEDTKAAEDQDETVRQKAADKAKAEEEAAEKKRKEGEGVLYVILLDEKKEEDVGLAELDSQNKSDSGGLLGGLRRAASAALGFVTSPLGAAVTVATVATVAIATKGYAFDTDRHLTPEWIKSMQEQGYTTALRYIDRYKSGKNIQPVEMAHAAASGLNIGLIYEEGRTDGKETFSYEKGLAAGRFAVAEATRLGYPPGAAIYFAIDRDFGPADIQGQVADYFRGVQQAMQESGSPPRYKIGVYGSGGVLNYIKDELHIATYGLIAAQASGWYGTKAYLRSGKAQIIQVKDRGTHDHDVVTADDAGFARFTPTGKPSPKQLAVQHSHHPTTGKPRNPDDPAADA